MSRVLCVGLNQVGILIDLCDLIERTGWLFGCLLCCVCF